MGLGVGEGGRIGGKILRNGDHHVIAALRQAPGRLAGIGEPEVQGGIPLQVFHQLAAHIQCFAFVFHRPVLIDQRHRQIFHAAVGVPHGTEKQGGCRWWGWR